MPVGVLKRTVNASEVTPVRVTVNDPFVAGSAAFVVAEILTSAWAENTAPKKRKRREINFCNSFE